MATLEIVNGPGGSQRHELTQEETTLGRYPFCDIVLQLNSISRQHARIVRQPDGFYVEDLNSLNGTFVNGQRIKGRARLRHQDQLQLYEIKIIFHEQPQPGPTGRPEQDDGARRAFSDVGRQPADGELQDGWPQGNIVDTLDASSALRADVRAAEKLQAILEITRALGHSLDVDQMLPKILDGLFAIFPQSARACILLAEEPEGELALKAIKEQGEETSVSNTLGPISFQLAARVMSKGEAILSADVFNDQELELSESVLDFPIRSMVCAPLMGPLRKPLGIVYVDSNDVERRFVAEDLDVLLSVATVAGQAVEYAREHEASIQRHRQAEEQLKRYAGELERSNLELRRFAYVAAHDLQEPLRTVGNFSELLNQHYQDRMDEEGRQWLGFLSEGARRMQALVGNLATYCRIDRQAVPFVQADCRQIVQQVLDGLEASIAETGAEVTCGDLPQLKGDPAQLTQLFENLIGNAIKFHGSQPPQIQVAAQRQDKKWLFSVRDKGIGVAVEHRQKIFELFRRPHHREEYPGTGLGLAVCRRIVQRHGGRIWVESGSAGGSVFYFTLPAQD